jgi:hypothetical protein
MEEKDIGAFPFKTKENQSFLVDRIICRPFYSIRKNLKVRSK